MSSLLSSRGDPGFKPQFATRIAGSADLYAPSNRKPYHSINFIIAHDGFTLADLVAYNEKHNDANGEGNRDGTNDNFSWNCGAEGATDNAAVVALRARQMRNLHVALMLSQGTPMVLIGDEAAASHQGNNNWYGHDGPLTHYNWGDVTTAKEAGWFRFYSGIIKLRKECPLLGRAEFLAPGDVTWHEDRWDDPESRFLAFTLHDHTGGYGDLYAAFNAHSFEVSIGLPAPPAGKKWTRVVDTNLPSPRDFTPGGNAGVDPTYVIQANSAVLLLAKNV
jgi:isoamylase